MLVHDAAGGGFLGEHILHRLEDQDIRVVLADTLAGEATYRRNLTVPGALTDSVLAGNPVKLALSRAGGGMAYRKPSIWIPRTKYRWVKRKRTRMGSTAVTPAAI